MNLTSTVPAICALACSLVLAPGCDRAEDRVNQIGGKSIWIDCSEV